LSDNFYIYNDTIYQGELSDIEALLAVSVKHRYACDIQRAKVVHVTPDTVANIKAMHQEIETKIQEVKNLQARLYDATDHLFLPR
jgi:hypothetical protein